MTSGKYIHYHQRMKTYEEIYGEIRAKNIKKKQSNSKIGYKFSIAHKKNISKALTGRKIPRDVVKKIVAKRKGKTYEEIVGYERANIWRQHLRDNHIGTTGKKLNPSEYVKRKRLIALYESLAKRPNSYELIISNLCIKYNLPFIYTGDGTFLIGRKNPDFKHEILPIVIEVYHNFWKNKNYGSIFEYKKQRKKYFSQYGYKVIFIGDEIINNIDFEFICLNKILEVIEND